MSEKPVHRGGRGAGNNRGGRGGGAGRGGGGGYASQSQQQDKERPKKENILDLGKYMDKQITVKFNGGREGKPPDSAAPAKKERAWTKTDRACHSEGNTKRL